MGNEFKNVGNFKFLIQHEAEQNSAMASERATQCILAYCNVLANRLHKSSSRQLVVCTTAQVCLT